VRLGLGERRRGYGVGTAIGVRNKMCFGSLSPKGRLELPKDRGLNKTQRLKSRLQEQNPPSRVEVLS
jgi:hypothetical protein